MFKLTSKEQKLVFLLGGLLVLGIILRFTLPEESKAARIDRGAGEASVEYSSDKSGNDNVQVEEEKSSIMVHVTGKVMSPGVYQLDEGARMIDALDVAGGSREDADLERVNLAQPLIDGQQVFIPAVPPEGEKPQFASTVNEQGPSLQEQQVNINMAGQSELETLPGIGSVKAQSIIRHREENGPFQQVEDLLQVSGIGEKTLENISEKITVY